MLQEVPAGSIAYIYYPNIKDINDIRCDWVVYSQKDFLICQFLVKKDTTMLGLWNKYSLVQPNFHPISVENITCTPDKRFRESGRLLLVDGTIPESIELEILNVSFENLNAVGKFPQYHYTVIANGCLPDITEVIQRTLNRFGVSSYIVIMD